MCLSCWPSNALLCSDSSLVTPLFLYVTRQAMEAKAELTHCKQASPRSRAGPFFRVVSVESKSKYGIFLLKGVPGIASCDRFFLSTVQSKNPQRWLTKAIATWLSESVVWSRIGVVSHLSSTRTKGSDPQIANPTKGYIPEILYMTAENKQHE